MKLIFAGTPEFATAALQSIYEGGFEIVGVITQTDKPQGRKGVLTPPPVKTLAERLGIPVFQPEKIRDEVEMIRALGAELMVTCAYGQILTQAVLDSFPKGVWNIHAGLLPKYRGASPIQSCILNGETVTGVSIMKTELGLDCGDILCVEETPIGENETYGELSDRLSKIGANLIIRALNMLQSGEYTLTKQDDEGVNVVRKINKDHAKIDFHKTVQEICNVVRGMNPAPVAFTLLDGNKVNVYRAERAVLNEEEQACFDGAKLGEVLSDRPKRGLLVKCADGAVKLTEVQAAGGKRISGGDFINGRKAKKGQVFEC
ncbi:MAG: methionyl-tRNA formyltransferase [Clostridiales bacterium]|nr:methionyl-tRNA formyltransferase [Clostridiales bacterium]